MIKGLFTKQGEFKLDFLKSKLFLIGLFVKIICSFLFAGENLRSKFIPFVNYFTSSGFQNPYQHFQNAGITDAFPYPPLMLYILSFFGNGFFNPQLLFFRIPLLICDIAILIVLTRLFKAYQKKILFYYWLSPVLLYISYIHGQLDIIPITFLFLSFYFIYKEKFIFASLVLGLGIATKTNLVIVIPFFVLYIWKIKNTEKIKNAILALLLIVLPVVIFNFPFLFNEEFVKMVYNNKEQAKVFMSNMTMADNLVFYVIPSAYIVLLAIALRFKRLSKDLFILFIGFTFSLLLLFIPPKPGWYFWIIPFFIFFYIKENRLPIIPFFALQLAFFIYFAIIPESDFGFVYYTSNHNWTLYEVLSTRGFNTKLLVNLSFTLLQTVLLLNIVWIYTAGIRKNTLEKLKNVPFLIGIGGDSGVGKSTLTTSLQNIFGHQQLTIIRGDDMHRWERGHEKWDEFTHLSPKANNLHEEIEQLKVLKNGKQILRRLYDHSSGKFTEPVPVYSNRLIVFEGLHPFYIRAKRELFDIKIFVDPEEALRLHWKVNRDIKKRGYTKEKVLEQLEYRKQDSIKYIQSQSHYADICISYFPVDISLENDSEQDVTIGLKITCDTNIDLNYFLEMFDKVETMTIQHEYDIDSQTIILKGTIASFEIEELSYAIFDSVEYVSDNAIWEADIKGALQIFLLYYIQKKITNE